GLSMAMQSAWLLGAELSARREALVRGLAHAEVAREYAALWRVRFAARVRWAALCAPLAMRPRATAALLPVLRRRPELLALCARLGGKVRGVPARACALRRFEGCEGPT